MTRDFIIKVSILMLFMCACHNVITAQVTTYFNGNSTALSGDGNYTGRLYSVKIFTTQVYVTVELVPVKKLKRMNYFTSPSTHIEAGGLRLGLLGALSNDGKSYHSCTLSDEWGWNDVTPENTYRYTLVFSGTIPAGVTKFSMIDDNSGYHGFSFRNYGINNPSPNGTSYDEYSVKRSIDAHNDGICGIYEAFDSDNGYKLGCIFESGSYRLIYLGGRKMSWWHIGDIKATLRASATPGLFKADWYMANKTLNTNVYVMFEAGSMKTLIDGDEDGYLKMYPTTQSGSNLYGSKEWSGTGFALKNGYLATNYHVIENAKSIQVQGINGNFSTKYKASVVATDKNNDIAVLRINDSSFSGFGSIPYNVKSSQVDVGEEIFVLGYPLTVTMGDEIKLTTGVISSKTGFQGDVSLYQISAPVQPGNSGGPLFDHNGNLIGIVSAKHAGAENVGYAIKASYLKNLAESYISTSVMPNNNQVAGQPLTSQVKRLKNFVYMITCSNAASTNYSASNIDVSSPQVTTALRDGLKIRRVQVTSNQTIVDFEFDNSKTHSGWVTISPNTYISYAGTKYTMTKAEGIPIEPAKHYFQTASDRLYFRLIFPPLPKDAKEFDLIESESSTWKFYGIKLK